jgi:hypothetical protein
VTNVVIREYAEYWMAIYILGFLQAQNSEEPFPTTSEDLAGFWDMVMLQVEHVNRLFEEITTLRAANWVEVNSKHIFFTQFSFISIIKCHIYLNIR